MLLSARPRRLPLVTVLCARVIGAAATVGLFAPAGSLNAGSPSLGYQITEGKLIGPRDMFADPSFDRARTLANEVVDYLRRHGPFEPHRLPLDEMEYPTMPAVAKRLEDRWAPIPDALPVVVP